MSIIPKRIGGVTIETEAGARIRAQAAVFATNSPVNDKVTIHTKQVPYRTYVIAGPVPKGSVADALGLGHARGLSLRPAAAARRRRDDLLIVGGEDHRSGEADDMDRALRASRALDARRISTSFGEVRYRWSGQVMEPVDFMPYSGRNPGNRNIYVHTGDSGQGITNGVAGALNIAALLFDQKAHFAELFDPSRKPTAGTSLAEFITGRAHDVKNLTEYVTGGDVGSADELRPARARSSAAGPSKIAAYRDDARQADRAIRRVHPCRVHRPLERPREMLGLPVPRVAVPARRDRDQWTGDQAASRSRLAA